MAQITLTVNPRMIERVIYWIVIAVLLGLLVLSYLNDSEPAAPSAIAADATQTITQAEAMLTELDDADAALLRSEIDRLQELLDDKEEDAEVERQIRLTRTLMASFDPPEGLAPSASCSDGIRNQDETDVDCGGSCTQCATGKACETASDCVADYCTVGKCSSTPPVTLSGSVSLSITDVETTTNPTTGAAKVTGVDFTIQNGKDTDLGTVTVKVFIKSKKSADYCLNQAYDSRGQCNTAYATLTELAPKSGKTQTYSREIEGTYLSNIDTSMYDHGDDVNVWLYLYDLSGNEIDGKAISTFRSVSP